MMLALLSGALATASVPAPPVGDNRHALLAFTAGAVRCGDAGVAPIWREPVVATGAWITSPADPDLAPRALRFRIDDSGRPVDIRSDPANRTDRSGDDVEAAFAAWQFPASAPARGCTVRFTPQAYAPDQVPLRIATRYAALPAIGGPGINVWPSFRPEGTTCTDHQPGRRVSVYPDFSAIPEKPGRLSYTFLTYDAAADGRPRRVRVLASDGNAALDSAAKRAMGRWRFVAGRAYQGCRYYFWRGGTPAYPAPAIPDERPLAAKEEPCGVDGAWEHLPSLAAYYPKAFRRRGIEGWALVRFDVASWGETGKVEVLQSEPADAFGEAARTIVSRARKHPARHGYVGCTDRVKFKMPDTPSTNVQAERG